LGVSESQRRALHDSVRAALGEEEGDTLMALSPPANTDIATRQVIERAEERLSARIDATNARITAMDERFDGRLAAMDERFDARITTMAAELRSHTWKVVVGTGVALYLMMVATMLAGAALLLGVLDVI